MAWEGMPRSSGGADGDAEGGEAFAEVVHEGGVARASAGDEEVGVAGEGGSLAEVGPDVKRR